MYLYLMHAQWDIGDWSTMGITLGMLKAINFRTMKLGFVAYY